MSSQGVLHPLVGKKHRIWRTYYDNYNGSNDLFRKYFLNYSYVHYSYKYFTRLCNLTRKLQVWVNGSDRYFCSGNGYLHYHTFYSFETYSNNFVVNLFALKPLFIFYWKYSVENVRDHQSLLQKHSVPDSGNLVSKKNTYSVVEVI